MTGSRAAGLALAAFVAGCGGGDPPETASTALDPGRQIAVQTGCLACHTLAGEGNDGPGPTLDRVGARLSEAEIRRVLVEGAAPMPSFETLPAGDLDALVQYLARLR